jgi:hypothetical protein
MLIDEINMSNVQQKAQEAGIDLSNAKPGHEVAYLNLALDIKARKAGHAAKLPQPTTTVVATESIDAHNLRIANARAVDNKHDLALVSVRDHNRGLHRPTVG